MTGESLTPDEAERLLDRPVIVDALRLNPKTDAGHDIKARLDEMPAMGVDPHNVLRLLARDFDAPSSLDRPSDIVIETED